MKKCLLLLVMLVWSVPVTGAITSVSSTELRHDWVAKAVDCLYGCEQKGAFEGQWLWLDFGQAKERPKLYALPLRMAVTSLALSALVEAEVQRSNAPDFKPSDKLQKVLDRSLPLLLKHAATPPQKIDRQGRIYCVWGYVFCLEGLLKLKKQNLLVGNDRWNTCIQQLIAGIQSTKRRDIFSPYCLAQNFKKDVCGTALIVPALQALIEARSMGYVVDEALLETHLDNLQQLRLKDGSFPYMFTGKMDVSKQALSTPQGSASRQPWCELVLYLAGRSDVKKLEVSLDNLFKNLPHLETVRAFKDKAKKRGEKVPQKGLAHKKPYGIAPYFYLYALRGASLVIEELPADKRPHWRQKLTQALRNARMRDGGFNDMHFGSGKGYGTAMALLTLLEPQSVRPARYAKLASS